MLNILIESSGWILFFGRFHPLLVHLPIGFLLIAAMLEIGRRTGRIQIGASAITFILLWSAIGAAFACMAGYLLSLGGGYDDALLTRHEWQGIGVAIFAWLAWFASLDKIKGVPGLTPKIYMGALGLSVLLTMTAGHDGGSLTHGEGFLTQHLPEPFRGLAGIPPQAEQTEQNEPPPIVNVEEAVVFKDIVQPIMQTRCVQCHNASKSKGDLRLDEMSFILKGGKGGRIFIAGNSTNSDLIKRCLLPENDDMHMPPKGKPQLTSEQVALLSWWIDQGAPVDKKVGELQKSDAVKPALASLTSKSRGESVATASPGFAVEVRPGEEKAITELRKTGMLVNPIAQTSNLLEVSAVNAKAFDDRQTRLLIALSDQIVSLKLGGTKITDVSLKEIAKLKRLNRLYLDRTAISDAGLANLKSLHYLEYLNLTGTKTTDTGLKNIASLKSLRSVYVWNSNVTMSTALQLEKANPRVRVVTGINEAAVAQLNAAVPAQDSTKTL